MIDKKSIDSLFAWLVPVLDKLFNDDQIQSEFSKKLSIFSPKMRWEAGPNGENKYFLAFSPNFDAKLLPLTEAIAAAAPSVPNWTFLSAKPRKQWKSRAITMRNEEGRLTTYVLDDWRYYLVSFKNGEFFDVNLVPNGTDASQRELERLGELLLLSEIGEKMLIEFIDRINIVRPEKLEHSANAIDFLHDQLLEQLAAHVRH